MAVYFFYGEEDYNIEQEIELMKSKLNQDFIAMNFQSLDKPKFPELMTALRTPPMMFGEMLIIINAEDYFANQSSYFEDKDYEEIESALMNNPDSLNIVFVVKLPRNENKKIDSRRKLYKILSKFNMQEFAPYKFYETDKVANWIRKNAKQKDITITDDAINCLIEQLGHNLRQLDNELAKLKLMAYPDKNVTKKMVEEISISNQDIFNITNNLLKKEKDKALLEFKKLTETKHPLEILSTLQTMIRKWIIIKTKHQQVSSFELTKLTGFKENQIKDVLKYLKTINTIDLVNLKQNLFDVEYKIKTGNAIDITSEVECALIR